MNHPDHHVLLLVEAILDLLRLKDSTRSALPVWKLLILDVHTQKIISPIIKVSELREHDVTLFLYVSYPEGPYQHGWTP